VTGASSGIGEATARLLAARGMHLALAGRDEVALRRVAAATGGVPLPGDLRRPGAARAAVAGAVDAVGGLDLLVSNAGGGWAGPFAEMGAADIDELLDVNLRAAGHLVHAALPHLRPGVGRVVLVGSIAGALGVAGEAWYSATKAGLAGFAAALRAELAAGPGPAVGITLVVPGVVATRFFERRNRPYGRDRPRPVPAARVASALVTAVERGRDEVVVPGWLRFPMRLRRTLPGCYGVLSRLDEPHAGPPTA
jgi:short-subunit dehydrogenase